MTKIYGIKQFGIWSEPKDGSENGRYDCWNLSKSSCEKLVREFDKDFPKKRHEVRKRPVKQ